MSKAKRAPEKRKKYKIYAAPKGPNGNYWAWPDKTIYVREFASEGRRNDYWRRFVMTKSREKAGLAFQLVMVNEEPGGFDFVSEPRYSDQPIIGKKKGHGTQNIVEC